MTTTQDRLQRATELVCKHFNASRTDFVKSRITHFKPTDFNVVWCTKTLNHWKATIMSPKVNGVYYEVTYDGNQRQTYLDVYTKVSNVAIPDSLPMDLIFNNKEN